MYVGPNLRNIREELGIPLGYLANVLGISISRLLAVERGKKHINKEQVFILCEMFRINKNDLMK